MSKISGVNSVKTRGSAIAEEPRDAQRKYVVLHRKWKLDTAEAYELTTVKHQLQPTTDTRIIELTSHKLQQP